MNFILGGGQAGGVSAKELETVLSRSPESFDMDLFDLGERFSCGATSSRIGSAI